MGNEDFQKIMLEEFKKLNGRMDVFDEKIDRLEEKVVKLDKKVEGVDTRLRGLEDKVSIMSEQTAGLLEFKEETRIDFETVITLISELDDKHSERYLNLSIGVEGIKDSINRIEINTAENWRDIARLKSVR